MEHNVVFTFSSYGDSLPSMNLPEEFTQIKVQSKQEDPERRHPWLEVSRWV
jgi:hypothetical protein